MKITIEKFQESVTFYFQGAMKIVLALTLLKASDRLMR
jgi:hypothetical protein